MYGNVKGLNETNREATKIYGLNSLDINRLHVLQNNVNQHRTSTADLLKRIVAPGFLLAYMTYNFPPNTMHMVPSLKNKVFLLKITFFVQKFVIVVSETGLLRSKTCQWNWLLKSITCQWNRLLDPKLVSQTGYPVQNSSVKLVTQVSEIGYSVKLVENILTRNSIFPLKRCLFNL